jgi:hypothetical protein
MSKRVIPAVGIPQTRPLLGLVGNSPTISIIVLLEPEAITLTTSSQVLLRQDVTKTNVFFTALKGNLDDRISPVEPLQKLFQPLVLHILIPARLL